jgi:hypothetical protein
LVPSDHYPAWLAKALLEDTLPWSDAQQATMPAFLDMYTLHDSSWIGFTLDPAHEGGGRVIIQWDTIWTDGRVPFPGSIVAEWPILIIDFVRVHSAQLAGFEIESPVPTRGIASAEAAILADPGHHYTVISDHFGGRIELVHAPAVHLLCLNPSGQAQLIPGLGAV